jgi:Peptidase family M23
VACLFVGACTSSSSGSSASPGTTGVPASAASGTIPSGIQDGYPTDVDELAPLVITTIAPDPIPVAGTDGKVHLVYELQVLNASPRPATLTSIETLAGGPAGTVLASWSGAEIAEHGLPVGASELSPTNEIPGGRALIVLMDGRYDTPADVPARLTHRLRATFGERAPSEPAFTRFFPTDVTQIGGEVRTSGEQPVAIGPPVAGDGWLAGNACCTMSSHRGAMLPFGGRINGAERYAIDYEMLDVNASPVIDVQKGFIATFHGDPSKNESYLAWDQPLLAVADGTVVKVVSDEPDITPGALPEGVPIGEAPGNRIIVDIGGGVFALFAHLRQGSPTVKVGDTVKRGQVIGHLGNSGNTSEPHLHFQLERGIAPLSGDNVPFEIDHLTVVGTLTLTGDGLVRPPTAGPRTSELPLVLSVTNYPTP